MKFYLLSIILLFFLFSQQLKAQITTDPNTGYVGVGTTTPVVRLDVNGSVRAMGGIESSISDNEIGGLINIVNPAKTSSGAASRWSIYNMGGGYGNSLQFWAYDNTACAGGLCSNRLTLMDNGNVGIGTSSPQSMLDVSGGAIASRLQLRAASNDGILIGNYNDNLGWNGTGVQPGYHIRFAGYRDVVPNFTGARISALRTNACCNALSTGMDLAFYTQGSASASGDASLVEAMRIKDNGNIGIGTSSPIEKLSVNGNIRSKKVIVTQTGWADYVFDSTYRLRPLEEVHAYVQDKGHLPDMPSAKEIESNGLDLGDIVKQQQVKIEELTLYIINQDKAKQTQQQQLALQQRQLSEQALLLQQLQLQLQQLQKSVQKN
jgi:hypothetical protein